MDQDAFRELLVTGSTAQRTPTTRGILPSKSKAPQQQITDSSKSGFKPRKVKKTDSDYRDRAAERRQGVAGDFAEVEAVLEIFEKQHANDEDREAVEKQRLYLGGDSEHSVLVKGLDFALLEQTKARAATATSVDDDKMLEDAFHGVSPSPPPVIPGLTSKKRTREDIVRELKLRMAKGEVGGGDAPVDGVLEKARKQGKFKPIGFKPIGNPSSKVKDGKEVRKKKKRKMAEGEGVKSSEAASNALNDDSSEASKKVEPGPSTVVQKKSDEKPREPEPAPLDEDFDIFAGAGEYEGVHFDDDDEEDEEEKPKREVREPDSLHNTENSRSPEYYPHWKWIDDDEPPSRPPDQSIPSLSDRKGKGKSKSNSPEEKDGQSRAREAGEIEDDAEPEILTRLAPLASSAVPSIRDILAADSALESEQKRKARKEKRKTIGGGGGGGEGEGKKVSAEAKLNRDYQKLKSFTEKKSKS